MVGIYKITSPSGKVYIGQSRDIFGRWGAHKYLWVRCVSPLYSSMKKYGPQKHRFEITHELPEDISQEVLNEYEFLYITRYKECGVKLLNSRGGGGQLGSHSEETKLKIVKSRREKAGAKEGETYTLSQEHKDKIGKAHKGMKRSDEMKSKLSKSLKGKSFSVERVEKMRQASKGKKLSESTKKKLSDRFKGEGNPFYGKKHTPENLEKARNARKGKKHSLETKTKMSESQKNSGRVYVVSEKMRQHLSNLRKGTKLSEEHKRKISEGNKGRKMKEGALAKSWETRRKNKTITT